MSAPVFDWTDPAVCAAWLANVAARCEDAVAVGEHQAQPLNKRRLGPVTARRLLAEAKGAILAQLRHARAGLPPLPPRVRVTVTPGLFASQRDVYLSAGGVTYALTVDAGDLDGDLLRVTVLAEHEGLVTVRFPREATPTSTVALPASEVLR